MDKEKRPFIKLLDKDWKTMSTKDLEKIKSFIKYILDKELEQQHKQTTRIKGIPIEKHTLFFTEQLTLIDAIYAFEVQLFLST